MRDKYTFVPKPDVPETHKKVRDDVVLLFHLAKKERKEEAERAERKLANPFGAAGDDRNAKSAALTDYEQAHLKVGISWKEFKGILLRIIPKHRARTIVRIVFSERGVDSVFATVNETRKKIGTIYHDFMRFEKIDPRPAGLTVDIYRRRGDENRRRGDEKRPPRHYIELEDETYLRRFVTRTINQNDSYNLSNRRGLKAPEQSDALQDKERASEELPSGHDPSTAHWGVRKMLLSHTRGWTKRFISATTTERRLYSTAGDFKKVFGEIVIDLARVPAENIYDLHRPSKLVVFEVQPTRILDGESVPPRKADRETTHEQFLAARDVIRTREIVIKRHVPFKALVFRTEGRKVVGLKGKGPQIRKALGQLGVENPIGEDVLTYSWQARFPGEEPSSRWRFLQYSSPEVAKVVQRGLPAKFDSRLFERFSPGDRPDGF